MNRTTKILVLTFVLLICAFGGLLFYANLRLKNLDLKLMAKQAVEKNFPQMNLEISEIDYSLGASVRFSAIGTKLKLKGKNLDLMEVKELYAKIPLWAIIVNGGTISVEVNSPVVAYRELESNISNWSLALQKNVSEDKDGGKRKPQSVEESSPIKVPKFLLNSSLDLRFIDTKVNYFLNDKSQGSIDISKFLVKNLNLREDTAFELASKFSMEDKQKKVISCEALVIGQLNLHEFIKEQPLQGKIVLTINNLTTPYFANKLSDLVTHLNLFMSPSEMKVNLDTRFAKLANFKADINQKGEIVNVSNINLEADVGETLSLVGSLPLNIRSNGAKFYLKGDLVKSGVEKVEVKPNVSFESKPDISISTPQGLDVKASFSGKVINQKLALFSFMKILEGEVKAEVKNEIDLMNIPTEVQKFPKFYVEVSAQGIKASKELIQKLIYAPSAVKQTSEVPPHNEIKSPLKRSPSNVTSVFNYPPMAIQVKATDILIGEAPFFMKGVVSTQGNVLSSNSMEIGLGKGKGNLTFKTLNQPQDKKDSNINFKMTHLNLDALKAFLPPSVESIYGTFDGEVSGDVTTGSKPEDLKYNMKLLVSAREGRIEGLNLNEKILAIIQGIPVLKDKIADKEVSLSDDFEILDFKGSTSNEQIRIDQFQFIGLKKSSSIKGSGDIYPLSTTKEGVVVGIYKDLKGEIASLLKKNIGSDELPFRLKGIGYALTPDIGYTLEKILKSAWKNNEQVQKVKQKAEEKIKEEIKEKAGDKVKDLIKDNKEGLNKVFKGLFK